jgi:sensor histidine kinase YesM
MKLSKTIQTEFFTKGIRWHILASAALFAFFCIFIFGSRYYKDNIPKGVFLYLVVLCGIYTARWISGKWLFRKRWMSLVIFSFGSMAFFSIIGVLGFTYFLHFKSENTDNGVFIFIIIPGIVILSMCGASFLAITRIALRQQLTEAKVAQQQKEAELNLLRSQLSPHFLFNSLNNLYGLSITHHEKIPGLLLKLSDLLRYSVYEARQDAISLNDELTYIQNYIEFEKIRLGERLIIHVQLEQVADKVKIAPMVFIVFVENAFKHAKNTLDEKIMIEMRLFLKNGIIYFFIQNSVRSEGLANPPSNSNSGFGIESTLKRLQLLYPGTHLLKRQKENGRYEVQLQLKAW